MSLKAKLEAVIYAAEEPVTLAQLALLFTADALEWKTEQQAAAAANPSLRPASPCLLKMESLTTPRWNQWKLRRNPNRSKPAPSRLSSQSPPP